MNYKNITLVGLLLPIYCLGNMCESLTLEQLQEKQYQKLLEIRDIQEVICRSEGYIKGIYCEYKEQLDIAIEKKQKELPNATNKEIEELVLQENYTIYNNLYDALRGKASFNYTLLNTLFDTFFDDTNETTLHTFHGDRFLQISGLIEQLLMRVATIKYQRLIQELIIINNNIIMLKGRTSNE